MAVNNFSATPYQNYINSILEHGAGGQSFEDRKLDYNLASMMFSNATNGILSAYGLDKNLDLQKNDYEQVVTFDVLKANVDGTGVVRKRKGAGGLETDRVTVTLEEEIMEEFSIPFLELGRLEDPAQIQANFQMVFNRQLDQKLGSMARRVNTKVINYLEANLNTNALAIPADETYYTPTAGVREIPLADQAYFVSNVRSELRYLYKTDYSLSDLMFVGSNRFQTVVENQFERFGNQNSENRIKDLNGVNMFISQSIDAGTGNLASFYVFPRTHVGAVSWVQPYDKIAGAFTPLVGEAGSVTNDGFYKVGNDVWGVMEHPFLDGLKIEIKNYEGWEDNSADKDGSENDIAFSSTMVCTVGFVKAYSSVAGDTPIVKYALSAS